MHAIRTAAPPDPGHAWKAAHRPSRKYAANPATTAASVYRQMARTTGIAPNPIGRPAYQMDGSVSTQNDTVHATAMPCGPHGSPPRNSAHVTTHSKMPHFSHRSACPSDTWIHPCVPFTIMMPMAGAKNVKIHPAV